MMKLSGNKSAAAVGRRNIGTMDRRMTVSTPGIKGLFMFRGAKRWRGHTAVSGMALHAKERLRYFQQGFIG